MAHILLVDDDLDVVAGIAAAIEPRGHSFSTSSSSAEAADIVRREAPDLVVLEAILDGGFGGVELARELADDYPDLPLIMLTRADEQFSPHELATQDRDGNWVPVRRYLSKPVLDDVIAYEIEHLLPAAG